MALERWDVIAVPAFVLGFPEDAPDHFGIVVSSKLVREGAGRYWILQIPNPAPQALIEGDIEVPYLSQILPPKPAIIRTSSIFAAHHLDLPPDPIVQLHRDYRRPILGFIDKFLPRR